MKQLYLLIITSLLLTNIYAQQTQQPLSLRAKVELQGNTTLSNATLVSSNQQYVIAQFTSPPTIHQREELDVNGIKLVEYISNHAWVVQLSANANLTLPIINTINSIPVEVKIAERLLNGDYPNCSQEGEAIKVYVYTWQDTEETALIEQLLDSEVVVSNTTESTRLLLTINPERLLEIATHNEVKTIEPIPCLTTEGLNGRSSSRIQYAPSPVNALSSIYTGLNIKMAIADDGKVNHLDMQNRIISMVETDFGTHGDMTVGIAIGSGNLNPLAIGMAPNADVFLYSYFNEEHHNNAINNYLEENISITSSSYSEGCGGIYTQSARILDQQVFDQPEILHCFSTGNKGGIPCNDNFNGYQMEDGAFYGNITGGKKTGKNVIAVGNIQSNDMLYISSSRGPTNDLRIKPDICALGQGNFSTKNSSDYQIGSGTSAAAPVVAGGVALIQEAYKNMHDGEYPSSGLVKPTLLNTADDLGTQGPDYQYGWGRIHLQNALEVIENNQYLEGQISHGQENFHSLIVPEGIDEVRVMLYWIDKPSSIYSAKALVNDLDIEINTPSGANKLPHVLSTFIHPDSLARPALPGKDRVNNVEQIVINNPEAGQYQIKIDGFDVPEGNQHYHIIYHFSTKDIEIVAPQPNENIVPGETYTIRWDALYKDAPFTIEYSTDNMQTWNTISNTVEGHHRHYNWQVPNLSISKVHMRVTQVDHGLESINQCSLFGIPDFNIDYVSPTIAKVSWNNIDNAIKYNIYRLGEKHMEVIGSTTDKYFFMPINEGESDWFAISAINTEYYEGRRSIAEKYTHNTCNSSFSINFQFDIYPEQTSWELKTPQGEIVATGGPYTNLAPYSTVTEYECVPAGCYYLIIKDSQGNGMCCSAGYGSFEIFDEKGDFLTSGGEFSYSKNLYICLEPQPTPLTVGFVDIQEPKCTSSSDGSLTAFAYGGTGNYTYQWSTGAITPNINNLPAGNYSVTINDGQEQKVSSFSLDAPTLLTAQLNTFDINCEQTNGSISAQVNGGTPPYTYYWSDGSTLPVLTTNVPGTYSVIITDFNGCLTAASAAIQSTTTLPLNITSTPVSCNSTNDGSAMVTNIAGATYLWNNGATTPTANNLFPGLYTVTVTNSSGCMNIASIEVESPTPITIETNITKPMCFGNNNGNITALASGGTGPYQYNWSTGNTTPFINNLGAGIYHLTVTDNLGCHAIFEIPVTQPQPLNLNVVSTDATTGNNGIIQVYPTGGTPPYNYQWSNGTTNQHLLNISGGTYAVTVIDNNGCIENRVITIDGVVTPPVGEYCSISGNNTNQEWIESVQFAGQTNISGNNGGYGDYTTTLFNTTLGQTYTLVATPGFTNHNYSESWRVWIDFNGDFDFDDPGEMVISSYGVTGDLISNIIIPNNATIGQTRMRIAMKYGPPASACGNFSYGEAEDYTIFINGSTTALTQEENSSMATQAPTFTAPTTVKKGTNSVSVYPNPTTDYLFLDGHWNKLQLFNNNGQLLLEQESTINTGDTHRIDVNNYLSGVYWLVILQDGTTITQKVIVD